MDLETENQIASILMKEAAELRRQAEKEGVHAYLREKNVRFRPNSRFLTATVLGVQQANKVAEVNDMWRLRKKELEVKNKYKGSSSDHKKNHIDSPKATSSGRRECNEYSYSSDDGGGGLKDEELEQFLHSRVKRGRGGIGARMDEPGPYLPRTDSESKSKMSEKYDVREKEERERRVLGPEKPASLMSKSKKYNEDEEDRKKSKKVKDDKSKKHSKDYKRAKEREEKRSKHHKRKRSRS